ncbi:glycosyltransferase family 2 protein [Aerosakkonemataceae cyanobacterium BLCC-F154]|uniref:Glycosyltransferase family 2 protein n=1 Tax=Floridaenema fluviatile BLCC-F154 TaxID=3153640 RepID=A0ABV4YG46_9CYAN
MEQLQTQLIHKLPSFSIVIETENLANANPKDLAKSLNSLANQEVSPNLANEVLLLESGDTPPELLKQLCQQYPWIKVHYTNAKISYYGAKMLGAELVTGEIVVYCDSDCIYQKDWLKNILTSFTQGDDIAIVAGETVTRGSGPYGTAMALSYIFPQYSEKKSLTKTSQYFLNNVAFRKDFFLKHPIPLDLPLYRGNCVIHAYNLLEQGYTIWQQPQAKANHAPPSGLSHFFWRFLLMGHDYFWQKSLLKTAISTSGKSYSTLMLDTKSKLQAFWERLSGMLIQQPLHLVYLPFAIPIIISSIALIVIGYLITVFQPNYLLNTYQVGEEKDLILSS